LRWFLLLLLKVIQITLIIPTTVMVKGSQKIKRKIANQSLPRNLIRQWIGLESIAFRLKVGSESKSKPNL
jgi:hypothetical protein